MAERVIHQLIDDLDGSEIADGKGGSVEFAVRGVAYRIDLTTANAAKFDKAVKPYVDAATRVGGRRSPAKTGEAAKAGKATKSSAHLAAIRTWARDQGYEVADRGRISAEIVAAYEAAH